MNHFVLRDEFPAFKLFWKWIVHERLSLSFDLVLDRTWTLSGSIKVINQTSSGPWTNNVRHSVIICYLRLVKTRKIENLVREFGFLLSCEMSQMHEREKTLILFVMCEKAKYFYVTEFYKGVWLGKLWQWKDTCNSNS